MPDEPDARGSLTALDWLVIAAAAVSIILAVTWLMQGKPPEPAAAE